MDCVQHRQLFDHLGQVIITILAEESGVNCARTGVVGRRILNRLKSVMEHRIATGAPEPAYNLLEFVDEAFDGMINDYRISENDLHGLRVAYCTARILAGIRALA